MTRHKGDKALSFEDVRELVRHCDAPRKLRLVFAALVLFANLHDDGTVVLAYPSVKALQRLTHQSRVTVYRHLAALARHGELRIDQVDGRRVYYFLRLPQRVVDKMRSGTDDTN